MPFTVVLIDPNNPSSVITFTEANFDGLNYADEATGFPAALGAVAKTIEYVGKATSTSSHNFTTGSKTFAIVGGFGFAAGTAVRVADVAGTSYMDGLVTACTPNSSLTVNVLSVGAGSGSNSSWAITLGTNTSTIVSTPVSIANGGTAGATAALARTNLEVDRNFDVLSVLSTPPGSPANGDAYIVGASPTGAFSGHEHERALYSSGWGFTTPGAGTRAYDAGAKATYVYTGTAQYVDGIYYGSKWKPTTPVKARWAQLDISGTYSVSNNDHGKWLIVTGSTKTITLPATYGSMGIVIEVLSSNTGTTTISISGGLNFRLADGTTAASLSVSSSTYKKYRLVAGPSDDSDAWHVLG